MGDALGHRRAGQPPKNIRPLHAGPSLGYTEAIDRLGDHGVAVWDVLQTCEREGSLDSNIKNPVPNDVRGFCDAHPTIRTICLASGSTTAKMFIQHNKAWLGEPGQFCVADDARSKRAFAKMLARANHTGGTKGQRKLSFGGDAPSGAGSGYGSGPGSGSGTHPRRTHPIELCVMPSVSPAAASITYQEKRDTWMKLCFRVDPTPL